ncbi:TPA: type III toxin-antitoxin system ToxN/AbiQ family toxin [Streptococcus suis]|nr:type III toxin-antitoxin system ToxN/AbiQ family toxin [Streptococcus suis]HEN0485334.1 type III toxin-antitoxin system ToxN/AbiQ family toxin [Streptococcus suis]
MFGFYHIDVDYLEFLHKLDSEVEYSSLYKSSAYKKVFLGIITTVDNQKYFIPFTSAKRSHENPKISLSSKNHMLIYEVVNSQTKNKYPDKFYRSTNDTDKFYMLISCLQFNKAIPVNDGLYSYYDIANEPDQNYKNMLMKEYSFCIANQADIIAAASQTIEAIKRGVPVKFACDLNLLESKMNNFSK